MAAWNFSFVYQGAESEREVEQRIPSDLAPVVYREQPEPEHSCQSQ
jgi:hypothetical protein